MKHEQHIVRIGARDSPLSKVQVKEILSALQAHHPEVTFETTFVKSKGDKDLKTSLRHLHKTDFFTKEIDDLVLLGACQAGIHSAKDLPDPLPEGLYVAALTEGLDPSDVLVLRHGETLNSLPPKAVIATSSERREDAVRMLRSDFTFIDIRGTIEQRLEKLENREADGVVVAMAALIRLGLTELNIVKIPGETVHHQGRLAVVARKGDKEMGRFFGTIDARKSQATILYLGLNPPPSLTLSYHVIHYPVIQISPFPIENHDIQNTFLKLAQFTHLIFTSQSAVNVFMRYKQRFYGDSAILTEKRILAIGQSTAARLKAEGFPPHKIAEDETSEGIIELLKDEKLGNAHVLWPHSALSRPIITEHLRHWNIPYTECSLYTTLPLKHEPVPDLKKVDEIIFTSPSTVDNFLKIYGAFPQDKVLTTIGPVTQSHLDNKKEQSLQNIGNR